MKSAGFEPFVQNTCGLPLCYNRCQLFRNLEQGDLETVTIWRKFSKGSTTDRWIRKKNFWHQRFEFCKGEGHPILKDFLLILSPQMPDDWELINAPGILTSISIATFGN